jgi:excisionase family DNA binding protein
LQAYTVEQVAKMLHISRAKVYYLLRTRQLRRIKIGKFRRITDRHLADFIASLEDSAALYVPKLRPLDDHRRPARDLCPGCWTLGRNDPYSGPGLRPERWAIGIC